VTDITAQLAQFTSGLTIDAIPAEVRERAGVLAVDSLGIAIRARHDVGLVEPLIRAIDNLGMAHGDSAVVGDAKTYSAMGAALLNGTLIHALDFDDTFAPGALHPSAPTLGAALVAAEREGASGADLVCGIVAGYEVLCRLARALGAADHYDRGFHPSATCGAFGATAAAARIMKLTPEQVADAFGIVLSMCAGSMQFLANGAWTKAFQVGNAGAVGLMAATMAREGYRGAAFAIEGDKGFLNSYAPAPVAAKAVAGLGEVWETLQIAIKPYPSCRFAHALMDGAIALASEHGFALEDVAAIDCGLSRKAIDLVGKPIEQKRLAATTVEGQFSAPFLVSVAIAEGGMGWESYSRQLDNPAVRACMQKVSVEQDPRIEALFPASFGGAIKITLADGRVLERVVEVPKGEPENFVSADDIRTKFFDLVHPYLGERTAALFETILNLENADVSAMLLATRA
jgi:2-methylcitrate dehydratase PrpD